ncbi:MAG: ABC transporter substrate-binding protein [Armatimonadetes bacterium]|nr:ABC transporter substrate-binding protein [Armatimonadota bacterium]
MSKRRLWVVAGLAVLVGLAAWRLVPRPAAPTAAPAGTRATANRVATLSPALSEIAFAIGAGTKVCGVADFTIYPPEADKLPRLGAFINPNLELLASLKPDLVVVQGQHDKVRDYCRDHGQAFAAYPLDKVEDVFTIGADLGRRLGCAASAERAVASWRAELAAVREAVKGEPPVKTYLSIGRPEGRLSALTTCNQKTFLSELLAVAGGQNVFADAIEQYPQPSLESLVQRAPEVILDLQPGSGMGGSAKQASRADWQAVSSVPAVRNDRIVVLSEDYLLIPGPRLTQTARLLARALHPKLSAQLADPVGR